MLYQLSSVVAVCRGAVQFRDSARPTITRTVSKSETEPAKAIARSICHNDLVRHGPRLGEAEVVHDQLAPPQPTAEHALVQADQRRETGWASTTSATVSRSVYSACRIGILISISDGGKSAVDD
jgi:hypothetical protein